MARPARILTSVKILLSDGSGLTARQVAGRLSESGHEVEALSPGWMCLCRFTRHVRRVHPVPSYGADPLGWLDAALAVYRAGGFDVLFPTQEQVAALSHSAGRLLAAHANLRVREGARGGASHKRSANEPAVVVKHLDSLGRSLRWHGGLSADAILTDAGPVFIDINPRLVEPGNAWRSGVDLVGPLLDAACGRVPQAQPPGRPGVATHQLLLAALGAGADGRGRRGVAAEILGALTHTGSYRGSAEELTPVRGDPLAALPVLVAAVAMLIRPALWSWFAGGSVAGYALTPAGWDSLLNMPPA